MDSPVNPKMPPPAKEKKSFLNTAGNTPIFYEKSQP